MGTLGTWELLIILVIIILVFGIGRISKIGGELGKGIRSFREGLREGQEDQTAKRDEEIEKKEP